MAAFREQAKGLSVFEFVQAHGAFQRDHAVFFDFRVNEGWERVDYRRVKAGVCEAAVAADAVLGQEDGDAAHDDNEGAYERVDDDGQEWVEFDLVVQEPHRRVSLRGRVRRMEGQCDDEKEDGPNDGAMRGGKELNHNTSF